MHASGAEQFRPRALLLLLAGTLMTLLALPVVLLFELPLVAWGIGAGLVLANALVHGLITWIVRDASITATLGAMGFSMIGRAGATALTLFFVGASVGAAGDRQIGMDRPDLARVAIVIFLIGFTVDAMIDTLRRASQRGALPSATPVQETTP